MNLLSSRVKPSLLVCGTLAFLLFGCASATLSTIQPAPMNAPKPDGIVVEDFDVSPAEIMLDRGIAPQIARELGGAPQTAEEAKVGRLVAEALAKRLVAKLRESGLAAYRAEELVQPSDTTLIIKGYFKHVDEGDQNLRVVIGFGLGSSTIQTHGYAFQNGKLVGEAETKTDAGLKPGMAVSALGGTTGILIGVGTTTVSETFMATVEADANRTADEIAKKIVEGYKKRGW